MKLLLGTTLLLILGSCARIMNSTHSKVSIYTDAPAKIVVQKDTISTLHNKLDLKLLRSSEPIAVTTITDRLQKTVMVKSQHSLAYLANIICNYGIGLLIERKDPKRYSYPRNIFITVKDSLISFSSIEPNKQGKLYLHLALPHINSFHLHPEGESSTTNTGFWGFRIGLDYFHRKTQFLNISASHVYDFFVPVPAAVDISGEYELMRSSYITISNNHMINRLSVGYGLSFASNSWDLKYYDRFNPPPPSRTPVKKTSHASGLVFSSSYQFGKSFYVGCTYRPTFYRFDASSRFTYEHLLSIDCGWKIALR